MKDYSNHESYTGDSYGNFVDKRGRYFMVRCCECARENYMPAVASGVCTWCGHVGKATDKPREKSIPAKKEKVLKFGRKAKKI